MRLTVAFAKLPALLLIAALSNSAWADEALDIVNYRQYTANLASSGQLQKSHLQELQSQGVQRIVYLAYRAHGDADNLTIDQHATDLGLQYVHIPVPWQSPSINDYRTFAAVMSSQASANTLVHCQLNYRASAFSFLYRVLVLKTPVDQALLDLTGVWQPNDTWWTFINNVLQEYDHPSVQQG